MLKHTKGNLLDLAEKGEFDIIVHGCNCFTTMGGGIAREVAERFPEARAVDHYGTIHGDYNKLGNYTETMQLPFKIINAYTQYETSKGEDVFEYTAFALILQKLVHAYGDCRFGFPYIGMGLAGGDKTRIVTMLENFAIRVSAKGGTVTLVEFA